VVAGPDRGSRASKLRNTRVIGYIPRHEVAPDVRPSALAGSYREQTRVYESFYRLTESGPTNPDLDRKVSLSRQAMARRQNLRSAPCASAIRWTETSNARLAERTRRPKCSRCTSAHRSTSMTPSADPAKGSQLSAGVERGKCATLAVSWAGRYSKGVTTVARWFTEKPIGNMARLAKPDTMVEMIRGGHCDRVSAARPSIADRYISQKIDEGRLGDIREFIASNRCVVRFELAGPRSVCAQNAPRRRVFDGVGSIKWSDCQ
jgi:hypothetical protein